MDKRGTNTMDFLLETRTHQRRIKSQWTDAVFKDWRKNGMDFLKIADGTVSLSTHSIENYTKSFIYEHQFEFSRPKITCASLAIFGNFQTFYLFRIVHSFSMAEAKKGPVYFKLLQLTTNECYCWYDLPTQRPFILQPFRPSHRLTNILKMMIHPANFSRLGNFSWRNLSKFQDTIPVQV